MTKEQTPTGKMQKISRELEGAPVEAHGYRLRPVAQMQGWWGAMPKAASPAIQATGGGAFVQVTPTALYIERAGHAPQRMTLVADEQPPLRTMLVVGLAIAVVSLLINLLIRLRY